MTDDLEGLWKMKHVAACHVGPQQLLQEEVSEDVTVLVSVILQTVPFSPHQSCEASYLPGTRGRVAVWR